MDNVKRSRACFHPEVKSQETDRAHHVSLLMAASDPVLIMVQAAEPEDVGRTKIKTHRTEDNRLRPVHPSSRTPPDDRPEKMRTSAELLLGGQEGTTVRTEHRGDILLELLREGASDGVSVLGEEGEPHRSLPQAPSSKISCGMHSASIAAPSFDRSQNTPRHQ